MIPQNHMRGIMIIDKDNLKKRVTQITQDSRWKGKVKNKNILT